MKFIWGRSWDASSFFAVLLGLLVLSAALLLSLWRLGLSSSSSFRNSSSWKLDALAISVQIQSSVDDVRVLSAHSFARSSFSASPDVAAEDEFTVVSSVLQVIDRLRLLASPPGRCVAGKEASQIGVKTAF